MKVTTTTSVDGTLIVVVQHCVQDLLTITKAKCMDQGKEKDNMFTQETVGVVMDTAKGGLSFFFHVCGWCKFDVDKPLFP